MTINLCMPWRTDHGQRERVFKACMQRWARMFPTGTVYLGTSHEQPFNRSAARNAAVEELTLQQPDWDVLVMADADVQLASADQVRAAVSLARDKLHLVFAHNFQARLGPEATERVLAGEDVTEVVRGPEDAQEWEGNTLSGVYAVPRKLWEALGGFDERHVGHGFEDVSFAQACRVLAGRSRAKGLSFHLWHEAPREEREGQPHYEANRALYQRYMAADRHTIGEVLAR